MDVELFDYELPEELIAQTPIADRSASRMLVLDTLTGGVEHRHFNNISDYLQPGDCLVLNDTKVLPARLFGVKEDTGAAIEVLLLTPLGHDTWETLAKPAKRIKEGTVIDFGEGKLQAVCVAEKDEGIRHFRFQYDGDFYNIIDELGKMPLPPYIHETLEDSDRYQTVYAKHRGSAAAPTAGLHFTDELLDELRQKGIQIAFLTLHVGLGTFRPVSTDTVEDHKMHSEFYRLDANTAQTLNDTRQKGHKIIACGTTAVRTLETIAQEQPDQFQAASGWTDIFIFPGYTFQGLDGMITNFHLPKSTLIMLVSAFAGRQYTLSAYEEAVSQRYRFFSFGDAMLLLKGIEDDDSSNL